MILIENQIVPIFTIQAGYFSEPFQDLLLNQSPKNQFAEQSLVTVLI